MSFLNQLKSQANALQKERTHQEMLLEDNTQQVEVACRQVLSYLQDLARQLSVIEPPGPAFTLDGKTPWPAMKLRDFRTDFRRKQLRDREVFDYIGMGWQVVPQSGKPMGTVTVNFPPDLERVEARPALGMVKHERRETRHPEKNTLQSIRFDHAVETRGNVTVTANHERGQLTFRLVNTAGFEVQTAAWPAEKIATAVLDELAKRIVSQPSTFV